MFGAASLLNPLIFISYVLICFAGSLISDLFAAAQINLDVTPVCNETRQDVLEGPRQWQQKQAIRTVVENQQPFTVTVQTSHSEMIWTKEVLAGTTTPETHQVRRMKVTRQTSTHSIDLDVLHEFPPD